MSSDSRYRLPDRRTGTMLLGLAVPQLALVAAGVLAVVLIPMASGSGLGAGVGLAIGAGCVTLAFAPAGGRQAYELLPTLVTFAAQQAGGRWRWLAPLPLLTGSPPGPGRYTRRTLAAGLPRCLAGLELLAVDRPPGLGAGRIIAPVGLVADRRSGTLTAVIGVRGGGFSLLDPADRARRLAGWAEVLSQFARESSAVARIGWTLWSAPGPLAEHRAWLDGRTGRDPSVQAAESAYRALLADAETTVCRHELRVWVSVDPRRSRTTADLPAQAVAAVQALTDRCTAAGLVCSAPLSPVQIAEAIRVQADPGVAGALDRLRRGLAERAGLSSPLGYLDADRPAGEAGLDPVQPGPLAMRSHWDAVQVDGAWHRVFWVARWPALGLDPRWWAPLLLAPAGVRTLAVLAEPVSPRVSRRRINAESVSVQQQLQLRERHAFRVPVHLQQAQAEVDEREAELQAGYPEYSYLALVAVTAASRSELDQASHTLLDTAAACGLTELRVLHGRQEAAWACTLPLGRSPDRGLLAGPR